MKHRIYAQDNKECKAAVVLNWAANSSSIMCIEQMELKHGAADR